MTSAVLLLVLVRLWTTWKTGSAFGFRVKKKKKKQRRDFVPAHHEDAFKRRRSASARLLGFGLVAGLRTLRVSFAGSWMKRTRMGGKYWFSKVRLSLSQSCVCAGGQWFVLASTSSLSTAQRGHFKWNCAPPRLPDLVQQLTHFGLVEVDHVQRPAGVAAARKQQGQRSRPGDQNYELVKLERGRGAYCWSPSEFCWQARLQTS